MRILYVIALCEILFLSSCNLYNKKDAYPIYKSSEANLESKNQYKKLKKISTGLYTNVYLIERSGKKEILKEINQLKGSESFDLYLKKLEKEAKILQSCRHPSIPKLYDYENGKIFMELKKGITLKDFMIRMRGESFDTIFSLAVKITLETLDLIDYLHQDLEICHRDIHFLNLLVDDKQNLSLLDFGEAISNQDYEDDAYFINDMQKEDVYSVFSNFLFFFHEGFVNNKSEALARVEDYTQHLEDLREEWSDEFIDSPAKKAKQIFKHFLSNKKSI